MLYLFNSWGVVGIFVVSSATGFTGDYPYSTFPMAIGAGIIGNNHGNPLIKLIMVQTITADGYRGGVYWK